MKLHFTKMHGAGNDFVVIDATTQSLSLSRETLQRLGDRRLGVGADQILVVEAARDASADFRYRIFNGATGQEVEHCGNGARCFVRFVHDKGLSQKNPLRVQTVNRHLTLTARPDGRVTVDMGSPAWDPAALPFDTQDLTPLQCQDAQLWPIPLGWVRGDPPRAVPDPSGVLVSMGNPHVVLPVADIEAVPVASLGPAIEHHPRFAHQVNVGFMQVLSPQRVRVRVWERGAGETASCGTGACAAAVAGLRMGVLTSPVEVETRGGLLRIEWEGVGASVRMTGPAETVFEGEIEL